MRGTAAALSFAILLTLLFLAGCPVPTPKPTVMKLDPINDIECGNAVSVSGYLYDSDNKGIGDAEISLKIEDHDEKVATNKFGKFSFAYTPKRCPGDIYVVAVYNGYLLNLRSEGLTSFKAFSSTKLEITESERTVQGGASTTIKLRLTDARNKPVPNAVLSIREQGGESFGEFKTDFDGVAEASITLTSPGVHQIEISYPETGLYRASKTIAIIEVANPRCSDGTEVGQCSKRTSYYCSKQLQLAFDCGKCGCAAGQVCYQAKCISQEQQTAELVTELQKSVVYVEHSTASGSGVIIDHTDDGYTIILTNRHVVEDAASVSEITIVTGDEETARASQVRVAPNGMDLAVIYIRGTYGELAKIDYSKEHFRGEDVIVLGSPLGIQRSVSKGIISNFVQDKTDDGYQYLVIQTDAAISPGNSGGGLFSKSTGELLGINTFVIRAQQAEGLGFAISITELENLPAYGTWNRLSPAQRCSDGTRYGACSSENIGAYCDDGSLVADCEACGCASGYYCQSSGKCFTCLSGYDAYINNNGEGYCCPSGYDAYVDKDGEGFCCPPGTKGYVGKYCD